VWELAENCCGLGMGTGQEPGGTGAYAVGTRYQRTGEDPADLEDTCHSEFQSVLNSNSATITCCYDSITNLNLVYSH
jgi:hypothetical protein